MGGHASAPAPAPAPDNSGAVIAEMDKQFQQQQAAQLAFQQQQAAAAAAAQLAAQNNAAIAIGLQKADVGSQNALQALSTMNTQQQSADAAATSASKASMQAAGQNATGGGFDLNASKQAALSNLGAAAGTLPNTTANQATPQQVNPAMTTAKSNPINQTQNASNFKAPSLNGITLGGS